MKTTTLKQIEESFNKPPEEESSLNNILCFLGLIFIIISIFSLQYIHLIAGITLLLLYGGLPSFLIYLIKLMRKKQ